MKTDRTDVYTRVTDPIVAELEKGVRPWLKPWNAEHAAGRITRPLRAGGQPYKGINVLMLWMSAAGARLRRPHLDDLQPGQGDSRPTSRKGSKGSLVVYADRITKTETGDDGEETERDIYFMKGYTVFNVEQIEGLPAHFYATAAPQLDPVQRIEAADLFFANTGADIRHGGNQAYYASEPDYVQMPPFEAFRTPRAIARRSPTS